MPEYRVEGVSVSGKPVQGIINAENRKEAKLRANQLAKDKKFKLAGVQERTTFIYRVKKGTEAPIDGEQKAFSKQEVQDALAKMGYQVMYVRKKLSIGGGGSIPATELVSFVRVSSDLIRQKLPFNDMMTMLANDVQNNKLRDVIKEINQDLKQGKDSEKSFMKHEKALGKFTAHMLGLASKSGNMADIFESTAKFLERNTQFKKDIKSALITPLITLGVLFLAVLFYIMYIFPATAKMFQKFKIELPPMTAFTLKMSDFIGDNFILLTVAMAVPIAAFARWASTERGKFLISKYIWKVPVVGGLIHKTSIEIFCRVFYSLYSGSGENIEVIRTAAEACNNKYMEHQIKTITIPLMVEKGVGLVEAFEASGVFTKTALGRFNAGAETGTVKQTALQVADYYEKETGYKMKNAVEMIQIYISMIIMLVLTALTVVSSETAMVKPKTPGTFIHFVFSFF